MLKTKQICPGLTIQSGDDGCWIFVESLIGLKGGINIDQFGCAKHAFQSWIYEQLGEKFEIKR